MLRIFGLIFCFSVMGLFRCAPEKSVDNKSNETPSGASLSMNTPDGTSMTIAGDGNTDGTSSTNLGLDLTAYANQGVRAIATNVTVQTLVNQKGFVIKVDPNIYASTPTSSGTDLTNFNNMMGIFFNRICGVASSGNSCLVNQLTFAPLSSSHVNAIWLEYQVPPIAPNGTTLVKNCGWTSNYVQISDYLDPTGAPVPYYNPSTNQPTGFNWQLCRVPVEFLVRNELAPGYTSTSTSTSTTTSLAGQTQLGNLLASLTSIDPSGNPNGLLAYLNTKLTSPLILSSNFPSTHFTTSAPPPPPPSTSGEQTNHFFNKQIQSVSNSSVCWIPYDYYDGTCSSTYTFHLTRHNYTISGISYSNLYEIVFAKDSNGASIYSPNATSPTVSSNGDLTPNPNESQYWAYTPSGPGFNFVDFTLVGNGFTLGVSDNSSNGTTGSISTQYAFKIYQDPASKNYLIKNWNSTQCLQYTNNPYSGNTRYEFVWHTCSTSNDTTEQFQFK